MNLVTPVAQPAYGQREEQNFREFVRRNLEGANNKISELTIEVGAAVIFSTFEMFGAVGDGVTDDSSAIEAALEEGGLVLGTPGKTYRIGTQTTVARSASSAPLILDLNGSTLFMDNAGLLITGSSTPILVTSLAVEPVRGATHLNLASVTGVQQGDLIEILSPALSSGTITVYHHYVVSEISGSDVWIEGTVVADINAAQVTADGKTGAIVVNVYRLANSVQVMSGTVLAVDTAGTRTSFNVQYHSHILADNIVFSGHTRNQLSIQWAAFVNVRDCTFRDFGYVVQDSGYVNLPGSPDAQSFGYGVITSRVYQIFVSNCRGGRGWHMSDSSRGTMHATIENCFFMRDSFGASSHEGCWHLNVINCTFDGGNGVIGARCAYLTVKGCVFRNMLEQSITYGGDVQEVRVYDCLFDTGFLTGSTQSTVYNAATGDPTFGTSSTGWERVFEMVGCTHIGAARVHAGFYGLGRLLVKNNVLENGAYIYRIYSMAETLFENNSIGTVEGNVAVSVNATGAETPSVVIKNNVHKGGFTSGVTSFVSVISGDPVLELYHNVCAAEYLLRFQDITADCLNCIGNVNQQTSGRMFLGIAANVVSNFFNNVWNQTSVESGGVAITRGANNFSEAVALVSTVTSNADFTITPFGSSSPPTIIHTGTLTADRAVTLSTTNATPGRTYRITRTGSGAFNLNVGTGPLKALATNTWCEVTFNGTAWVLTAYGAL